MMKAGSTLPSYGAPPINEVVVGVTFEPLRSLLIPYYGIFWQTVKDRFPICEHAAPLTTSAQLDDSIDKTTGLPLPRVWLINDARDELIQLQNERIFFNWRQVAQSQQYPRFSTIFPKFRDVFAGWSKFVETELATELKQTGFELTYINLIEKGEAWVGYHQLQTVFQDFGWKSIPGRFLPPPKHVGWQTVFDLPDEHGVLAMNMQPGRRVTDQADVIRFEITARTTPGQPYAGDLVKWFNIAHDWVVRGFADITNQETQSKIWKLNP